MPIEIVKTNPKDPDVVITLEQTIKDMISRGENPSEAENKLQSLKSLIDGITQSIDSMKSAVMIYDWHVSKYVITDEDLSEKDILIIQAYKDFVTNVINLYTNSIENIE